MELYRHFQDGATRITTEPVDGAIPLSQEEANNFMQGYQQEGNLALEYGSWIIRAMEVNGVDLNYIQGLVLQGKVGDYVHDEHVQYDSQCARSYLEGLLGIQWDFIKQIDLWRDGGV